MLMIYICDSCKKESSKLICSNCGFDNSFIKQKHKKQSYLSNFSFEWKIHSKTQFEEYNYKVPSSETFFLRTKKPKNMRVVTTLLLRRKIQERTSKDYFSLQQKHGKKKKKVLK